MEGLAGDVIDGREEAKGREQMEVKRKGKYQRNAVFVKERGQSGGDTCG